ncbi:MAG TPA: MFS transporter [Tepidisphaeraceae bacterium]|nr:MFS transporter [Tepidisphaeraceae bacterium]
MSSRAAGINATITLVLSTLLHAFTHAYGAMLVPLYLMIARDLRLPGDKWSTLIVTVYGLVYAILSYGAGVMADRVNRKAMLGLGLIVNAAAIGLMGLTRSYDVVLLLAVLAGIGGTVFHPAANALVPEHFPKSPGMAIGLLSIGSGIGFFAGPQYAGWRAQTAHWHFMRVANWQRPCVELGLAGLAFGVLFLLLAREARPATRGAATGAAATGAVNRARIEHPPLGRQRRRCVLAIAAVLGCRDFAGVASLSLASIYLQKAMGLDVKRTGLIVGTMMLMGVAANPLAVWLTPGRRRLPALAAVMVAAGAAISLVPLVHGRGPVLAVLCAFQALQLGSYAMSDAAMLERVPANVRGRVVGLFLTLAGTFAGLSPWAMGLWTDLMGPRALRQLPYLAPFATLGAMMAFAALSTPIIARLGAVQGEAVEAFTEIVPRTLEPAG